MARSERGERFTISAVAEMFDIHPQTLRMYEREGLLQPSRSRGNTRRYNDADLRELEVILHLTRDLGVNLAGVEVVLNMRRKLESLQNEMSRLAEAFASGADSRLGDRRNEALVPVSQVSALQMVRRRRS